MGVGVWMGFGHPSPPVRNDIVSLRHLFMFFFLVFRYSSFVKNMDKKFKTKRQRQNESSDEDEQEDTVKKQKTPNKIIGEVKTFLKPKEY